MSSIKKSLLLSAILSLCLTTPIHAQWTTLYTFPSPVTSVYFLDAQGFPNTGFVGMGGMVYRTMDGGTTWIAVQQNAIGSVTSFAFQNASTGWFSILGAVGTPAVYETTNGGATWAPLSVVGEGSSVYYNASNGLLFAGLRTKIGGSSLVSADGGTTWKPIVNQINENGFVFTDPLHGILTALSTPFYRTSNGGATWYNLGYTLHSWAPAAIPGTSTIVAAADIDSNIYASTDTGLTWRKSGIVSGSLTGCVQTGPCNVYVQTNTGIFNSSDLVTWIPMGGPGNTFDTRFYVGPTKIFAGDGSGNLDVVGSRGGGWPTVSFSPASIHITSAAGCPATPVTATVHNIGCLPVAIFSAVIADSERWKLTPSLPIPDTLLPTDSMQFTIAPQGDSVGTFHDDLQLWLKTSAGLTDTIITLDLDATTILPPTLKAPKIALPDRCTSLDTVFYIRNNHCDTIQIASLAMLDTTLFNLAAITLPISLPPDSEIAIPVLARPRNRGNFSDTVAIVLAYHGSDFDTTLALDGTVEISPVSATLSASIAAFDTITQCDTKLDTVYLQNVSCDSIEITEATFDGASFTIGDSILDLWIEPDDSLPIIIELSGRQSAGNYTDRLSLLLRNGGAVGQSYVLSISGAVRTPAVTLSLNPAAIRADSISQCRAFDTSISFTAQAACDSLQISSLTFTGNANVSVTSSPSLPTTILSGDTVTFLVTYQPMGGADVNGTIQAHGPAFDTSISLHLSFRSDVQPFQLAAGRTSFTVPPCGMDSGILMLTNPGCVPVVVDSLDLVQSGAEFMLAFGSLPFSIPADTTISAVLYFSGSSGQSSPIFDTLHAQDETGRIQNIPISGTILPLPFARVGLMLAPGSTLRPLAGDTTSLLLYFADSISPESNLQAMQCTLTFNGNVLTEQGTPTGLSGWTVQETSSALGTIILNCTRSADIPISPGQPIASLDLQASVSDSLSTPITLSSVNFTPNDPSYEQCTLASAIVFPSLTVELGSQCGDSILLQWLRSQPILSSIGVMPEKNNIRVTFQSNAASEVTVLLVDMVGRVRNEINYPAETGTNIATIPTSTLTEGTYFVEVSTGLFRASKQVAILR